MSKIQSRREFFKNAAKRGLSILGTMMLASTPATTQAKETPMGCNTNCQLACAVNCFSGCRGKCADNCAKSCSKSCLYGCKGGCKNSQNIN